MESKKGRLVKGSDSAKEHMSMLRSKRGTKKSDGNTPPPAAPCDCPPPVMEQPISQPKKSRKKITVDFV